MTATTLQGRSLIAGEEVAGTGREVRAVDPSTGTDLEPGYSLIDEKQLARATAAAAEAAPVLASLDPQQHGELLDRIAEEIEKIGDDVVARAMQETGLPEARLRGELGRTTGQLRLFATVVRTGDHHGVRMETALPDREPLPRPDLRVRKIPVGPVAVFGASNFPLAFSTAGGDTASALAAGCPVVVKAHNAHPGTGELVGRAVTAAVQALGLPEGTFSLVYGPGASIGQALVSDPVIQAVGFTGSRSGGTALMEAAARRPVPIPVYAEMSSINPIVVLPGALDEDPAALAGAYLTSVTGSSGQLCTAPGLLFLPEGEAGDAFAAALADQTAEQSGQTMLTPGIAGSWHEGVDQLAAQDQVVELGRGSDGEGQNAPGPAIFTTRVDQLEANPALHEEIFGAASLVVRYAEVAEVARALEAMEGQLTATMHLTERDHDAARELLPVLERRAGRVLVNGWPTGVEVCHAMVHGGPFPATSDTRTTSVGTLAIERFLRPVAYQNLPEALLPEVLRDGNPYGVTRLVDGTLTVGAAHAQGA